MKKNYCNLYSLFAALLFIAMFLYWPLLISSLSWIDDHEFVTYFPKKNGLRLIDVPNVFWNQTEIGSWQNTLRFRPFYFFQRVLLTSLFELRATPRFFLRIITAIITSGILAVSICTLGTQSKETRKSLRDPKLFAMSLVVAIVLLTQSGWSDIVTRLGPSELELAFGFSLFMLGFSRILISGSTPSQSEFFLLLSGLIICCGSKENGLVLVLPAAFVIFAYGLPSRHKNRWLVISSFVGCYCVSIFIVITNGIVRRGSDVYNNGRGIDVILQDFTTAFQSSISRQMLLTTALLFFISHFSSNRGVGNFSLLLWAIVITEQIYYSSNSSSLPRYLILSQLSHVLSIALIIFCLYSLIRSLGAAQFQSFIVLCVFLASIGGSLSGFQQIAEASKTRMEMTSDWEDTVTQITDASRTIRAQQIVIEVDGPARYELTASVGRFLAILSPNTNNVLLMAEPVIDEPNFDEGLYKQMLEFSDTGSLSWNIKPKSSLSETAITVCLIIGGTHNLFDSCDKTVRII
jgi:hypothetical protein